MQLLQQLQWRYATKKFDTNRSISDDTLSQILEAIRLAPSSYGVQPIHIDVISNKELRATLRGSSYDQPQISDCSHLLVFSARTDIHNLLEDASRIWDEIGRNPESIKHWCSNVSELVSGMSDEKLLSWTARQVYIALGFGLVYCAYLGVDACPMEGIIREEYKQILGLPDTTYPLAVMAIGYRDNSDTVYPKNRQTNEQLYAFRN